MHTKSVVGARGATNEQQDKTKTRTKPVYSASQAEGEVRWAVRLISGRHDGVRSRRKRAGQTDILRVTVRGAARHKILLLDRHLLRSPPGYLITLLKSDASV